MQYFPQLHPQKGQSVLVPLCGKTRDLIWLHEQGLRVHGVELYDPAVRAFFSENALPPPERVRDQDFVHYIHQNIVISCGDLFKLAKEEAYDLVYDRGALVALPPAMRKSYARVIGQALRKKGRYLLIAYEYDPSQMQGPPFSVDDAEIEALYGDRFTIRPVESQRPADEGPRLAAVESLRQKVYLLEKIR